jgi:hypothetical protein
MHREEFRKTLDEYNRICRAMYAEYNRICSAALDKSTPSEYIDVHRTAQAEYAKVRESAWGDIAEAVDDPLVSWIVKECRGYKFQAFEILRTLPASLAELDKCALEMEWHEEWTEFRNRALEAGVITEN